MIRCSCHKYYAATYVVERLVNIKPKPLKQFTEKNEGLEKGYEEERMDNIYLDSDKSWENIEI